MNPSSDFQVETELPESPSGGSLSNISSPIEEDGDNIIPDLNTQTSQNSNTLTASQLAELSQRCKQNRTNGFVQEYRHDGKVKLKISLKGLSNKTNDSITSNNDNSQNQINTFTQGSSTTQISQNVIPPESIQNMDPTSGDEFSDDLNLSQLESNSVQVLDLSELITVMKFPKSYNVKVKMTPEMKAKLQKNEIEQRQRRLKQIEMKRQQAKLKFASKQKEKAQALAKKAKAKPKKRPKPLYSRYFVNMTNIMPLPNRDEIYMRNMMKMKCGLNVKLNNGDNDNHDDQNQHNNTDDDELVEKCFRLSLKDPLSGSRMVTPLRSIYCSHVECFDYDSFLAMHNLKPFKIAIHRYSDKPSIVGDVNVLRLLDDTKRVVMNSKVHNKVTPSFPYKTRMKTLKEKSKQLNELEWFTCPICKIEFNIKVLGDVYVVGEFVDLLQDLSLEENNENVEDIEIDIAAGGKWRWIREDENDEKFGNHKGNTNITTNNNTDTTGTSMLSTKNTDNIQDEDQVPPTIDSNQPNNNLQVTKHNNIEVVTLDSDDEVPGDVPSASENIVNALVPLIQSDNPNVTEEEMMKQIDALFDADLIDAEDDTAASTPASSVPPFSKTSTSGNIVVGPSAMSGFTNNIYKPHSSIPCTNPNHIHHFQHHQHAAQMSTQKQYKGITQFHAGSLSSPFGKPLQSNNNTDNAPVFMSGEGAEDDPIVLD